MRSQVYNPAESSSLSSATDWPTSIWTRDGSIQSAAESGVSFIAVSLGANTDREYLAELTSASGGALIEAATPAELRQAYTSLAFAIRSQYTLVTDVPRSIDRTVAGTLKVHVIHRADNAFAERALGPLEGAIPPPFTMSLAGINPGDKHNGVVDLVPTVQDGIEVVKVEYILDGEVVHTSEGVGSYTLDASLLENGNHVLKVVATDIAGREGEVQVPFLVPVLVAASGGPSLPIIPILILAVLLILAFFIVKFGRKRWLKATTPTYSPVDTWASLRVSGGGQKAEEWSDEESEHPLHRVPAEAPQAEIVQGRVVIMDEAAVKGGELETIREFDIKSLPLSFGSGAEVDMRVGDAGGLIAAEEARVWVQRGRLVYHKLTPLSAMATEGVTAGWQFLDDGDEMRIGPYRLIFQSHQGKVTGDQATAVPDRLPQEHGMALRLSFGLTEADRSGEDQDVPEQAATPGHDPDATPDPSRAESADPSLDASGWDPSAGSSVAAAGGSSDMPEKSSPSDDSEESKEQNWGWDSTTPVAPADGGPTLLEPKSADWLVEQSQPIDDGIGQIVQPDAWGGFVTADDEAGSATQQNAVQDDSEEEPEQRARGA